MQSHILAAILTLIFVAVLLKLVQGRAATSDGKVSDVGQPTADEHSRFVYIVQQAASALGVASFIFGSFIVTRLPRNISFASRYFMVTFVLVTIVMLAALLTIKIKLRCSVSEAFRRLSVRGGITVRKALLIYAAFAGTLLFMAYRSW